MSDLNLAVDQEAHEADRRALEALVVDNAELNRLEELLAAFNLFEALGAVRQEIRHSDFLAFLLSPQQPHGLGDAFAKRLMQSVSRALPTGTTPVSAVDLDIWSLDDLVVLREWENIDILLLDAQHQFAVIIENKIDSGEHTDQLRRYQETVERHYPGWRIMCLFLTPEGDSPSDERYLPVSYALICSVLEALLVSRSSVLGSDVQVVIRHYTDMLRRHLVGASEIADLCRRIYQRHQRALDLIYEHRPDRQATIHSFLTQLIAETPDLVVDYSSKTRIGFHPKQWQAITAFFESGKGRPMLFFELQNTPDSLRLKLFIGPGAQETREYIYEVALAHQPPLSLSEKKLYPLWKMIYTKPLLSQKDYELADDELQQEARKHWATFIHTDLPAIVEQISQAFKARAM
jgi:PD-(D/E)XK nuclease superfamily protein